MIEMTRNSENRGVMPFLYLPIEIASRELDSRLLLACLAVEMGLEVVLGQKWLIELNFENMPPGIVLFKTVTPRDAKAMSQARRLGYHIAAIDEEMPGVVAGPETLRWVDEEAIRQTELLFAVGDVHLEALVARYPDHQSKFVSVGNPRFDLLRPEFQDIYRADNTALLREFGRYILVNTNFAIVNSGKGNVEHVIRTMERGGKLDRRKSKDVEYLRELLRFERANFSAIQSLLRELPTRFPEHCIVLRPHPNEDESTWIRICSDMPRVRVERRGAAIPWILASEILVHVNCTTGLEAVVLGKPAVSFQPIESPIAKKYLSTSVNPVARTIEEVVARIGQTIQQGDQSSVYPDELRAIFDRYFAARVGPLSAKCIIELIVERFCVQHSSNLVHAMWQPGRKFRFQTWLSKHRKARLMPDIDVQLLADKLRNLRQCLGLEGSLQVARCADRMFHVHGFSEGPSFERTQVRSHWFSRMLSQLAFGHVR